VCSERETERKHRGKGSPPGRSGETCPKPCKKLGKKTRKVCGSKKSKQGGQAKKKKNDNTRGVVVARAVLWSKACRSVKGTGWGGKIRVFKEGGGVAETCKGARYEERMRVIEVTVSTSSSPGGRWEREKKITVERPKLTQQKEHSRKGKQERRRAAQQAHHGKLGTK